MCPRDEDEDGNDDDHARQHSQPRYAKIAFSCAGYSFTHIDYHIMPMPPPRHRHRRKSIRCSFVSGENFR